MDFEIYKTIAWKLSATLWAKKSTIITVAGMVRLSQPFLLNASEKVAQKVIKKAKPIPTKNESWFRLKNKR